jgi:uncharacterized caspase-like protein
MRALWLALAAFVAIACSLVTASAALADHRVALVIGNSAYQNEAPLPNPARDAAAVGHSLERLGFDAIVATDLDKRAMDEAFRRFAHAVRDADVALFYYAGHGMQFQGQNYLMPVDARLADAADLPFEMARVDDVVAAMAPARSVRIVLLDACRDNPLADQLIKSLAAGSRSAGLTRGLARIPDVAGSIVAYATQAGSTAEDGNGDHSPFTAAFLANAESPGVEIGQMFRRVALAVNHATGGRQTPELSISLLGDFYLKPGGTTPATPVALPDATGPAGADKNHALVALDTEFVARQLLKDIANGTRQALSEAKIGFKGLATTSAGLDLQLSKPASGDKVKELVSAVVGRVLDNGACSSRLDVDDKALLHLRLDRGCFETRGLDSLSEVATQLRRRMGVMGLDQISVRVIDSGRIELGYASLAAERSRLDDIVRFASLSLHWVVDDPSTKAEKTEVVPGRPPDMQSYTLEAKAIVTGETVEDARLIITPQGEKAIGVKLDKSGTRQLADATAKGLGRRIAIVLDGQVISAPTVREPIEGGSLEISGFPGGAEDLAADLRAGQLSAPVKLVGP